MLLFESNEFLENPLGLFAVPHQAGNYMPNPVIVKDYFVRRNYFRKPHRGTTGRAAKTLQICQGSLLATCGASSLSSCCALTFWICAACSLSCFVSASICFCCCASRASKSCILLCAFRNSLSNIAFT